MGVTLVRVYVVCVVKVCGRESSVQNTHAFSEIIRERERERMIHPHSSYLWVCDRGKALLFQFFYRFLIIPKIKLGPDQDDGGIRTMMANFRIPL